MNVECTPIPRPLEGSEFARRRFVRSSPEVCAISPGWVGKASGVCIILVSICMASFCPLLLLGEALKGEAIPDRIAIVFTLVGLFMLVAGVLGVRRGIADLTDDTTFDRSTGRAARRWLFGTAWAVELSDVVAVQYIHGGWYWYKNGEWYDHHQLNLVVRAAGGSRLHVCSVRREEWGRALAEALAAFLEVPMLDQIAETRTPKPKGYPWARRSGRADQGTPNRSHGQPT